MQEVVELAGYTSRVGNMLEVFEEVGQGQYKKPSINGDSASSQRQWKAPKTPKPQHYIKFFIFYLFFLYMKAVP